MTFRHIDRVRFRDTDAAQVVYFANFFSLFHIAYEASLIAFGLDLNTLLRSEATAIPIVQARADYLRPLLWGNRYFIDLTPEQLAPDRFAIHYDLALLSDEGLDPKSQPPPQTDSKHPGLISRAYTEHVCIDPSTRQRVPLPEEILGWLEHHQFSGTDNPNPCDPDPDDPNASLIP